MDAFSEALSWRNAGLDDDCRAILPIQVESVTAARVTLKSDFVLDTPFLLSNESVLPIYQYQTGGEVDRKTPVSYNTKSENAI